MKSKVSPTALRRRLLRARPVPGRRQLLLIQARLAVLAGFGSNRWLVSVAAPYAAAVTVVGSANYVGVIQYPLGWPVYASAAVAALVVFGCMTAVGTRWRWELGGIEDGRFGWEARVELCYHPHHRVAAGARGHLTDPLRQVGQVEAGALVAERLLAEGSFESAAELRAVIGAVSP